MNSIKGLVCAVALSIMAGSASPASAQDAIAEWDRAKPMAPPSLKPIEIQVARTALILMDFDKKSCTAVRRARCADAIPRVAALIAQARGKHMLVVHFYNANMSREDIVPELAPVGDEKAEKVSGDKFYGTDLENILKAHDVDTVILAGTSANGAVLATALGAFEHKFKAIVPVDVMPADNVWQEQFSIWEIANGPGFREASTVTRTDMLKF